MTEKNGSPVPEILWYSCDGMMVIDECRNIIALNPAMERFLGRSSQELAGKAECGVVFSCRDLQGCSLAAHPEQCPGLKAIQDLKAVQSAEYSIRTAEGKARIVSTSYTPIQLPGHPVWVLAVMRDVTEQKKKELHLARQAMTDPVTGLANRTAFLETCEKELRRGRRHLRSLAVAMADLNGFKEFNDRYGHAAGDEILLSVGRILKTGRRATDLVARYGGDEFALVFPETDLAGALIVSERITAVIAKFPFPIIERFNGSKEHHLRVTISMGVAAFPEDGDATEELMRKADQRMYQTKQGGHNQVIGPTFSAGSG